MGKPYPKCCMGCWQCSQRPDTVALTAAGTGCCSHPAGTYTIGSPSNSGQTSSNDFIFDESTHRFDSVSAESRDCVWYWAPHQSPYSLCSFDSHILLEVCETQGDYTVIFRESRFGIKWLNGRIVVAIQNLYEAHHCAEGLNADMYVVDIYKVSASGTVDCANLPATINHYLRDIDARHIPSPGSVFNDKMYYGPNGIYTYEACPIIPSVSLTYVPV